MANIIGLVAIIGGIVIALRVFGGPFVDWLMIDDAGDEGTP